MLSYEYKAICLSSDHRKLIEDSSACFVLEINDFVEIKLILLVLKNVESAVEWIIIVNQK